MVIHMESSRVVRVSMTLDPIDVDLLDRLARLEGQNRSAELRALLLQVRPVLQATVAAFESAAAQRQKYDEIAAQVALRDAEALIPEADRLSNTYLGILSRIEGAAAAAEQNPRSSNTGVTPSDPPTGIDEK